MSLIARARRLLVLAGVAAVFAHAPVRAAEHEWTMQIAAQAGNTASAPARSRPRGVANSRSSASGRFG